MISSLDKIFPFFSLYSIILSIAFLVIPDTYLSREAEAVFIFTPTLLTHFSTTKSNDSDNFFCETSCWYRPTPIPSGGIFTSSAKGSCILLPILTALLFSTAKSGNSWIACGEALYIEAPASLTIIYLHFKLYSLIISLQNFSDSLEAVPLPIAIISTLYFFIKDTTFSLQFFISSSLIPFKKGLITVESKYFPRESITANLHPLTKPGSNARTFFSFKGGQSNRASRFFPKLSMAASSPFSVKSERTSLSTDGLINLL